MTATNIEISIVIPVKDEAESVAVLAAEIEASFRDTDWQWECLWIDDGSSDNTAEIVRNLSGPSHRLIRHDRNYGQSAAFYTGFLHARGQIIGTMDGDLQNDPEDLPRMLTKLKRGEADVVNGVRTNRQDSWKRKVQSRIANGFRNWVTQDNVTDVGCSLRVFYKEYVDVLPLWKGMHRFLPSLLKLNGAKVIETPVNHRPRRFGVTKYGLGNRLWVGLMDTFGVKWLSLRSVRPQVRR
jgi:glycosyltransferase involved in cell wall biosynthesis